jgi:hypothetical protein
MLKAASARFLQIRRTGYLTFSYSWIAELADKIGGAQQQTLLFDQIVIRGGCIGKARIFNCTGNSGRVELFDSV